MAKLLGKKNCIQNKKKLTLIHSGQKQNIKCFLFLLQNQLHKCKKKQTFKLEGNFYSIRTFLRKNIQQKSKSVFSSPPSWLQARTSHAHASHSVSKRKRKHSQLSSLPLLFTSCDTHTHTQFLHAT